MSKKISVSLVIFLIIMLGFWIWTLVTPKNSIVIGGSTSVNPFMQLSTKSYSEYESGGDFVYNSTGSQAGVGGVEKGMYAAGFISKDAKKDTLTSGNSFVENSFREVQSNEEIEEYINEIKKKEVSKSNGYLSIKFAIDAIGIIFNSPSYWKTKINNISIDDLVNFKLSNRKENENFLSILYQGNITWHDFANDLLNSYQNVNDLIEFNNNNSSEGEAKIPTYTREDGSGTRSAFSDITKIKKMPTSNVVNSNGAMIEQIRLSSGFGYVSNGFIQNIDPNSGIKLAGIDGKKLASPLTEGNKPYELDTLTLEWKESKTFENNDDFIISKTGYTFKRPFICITNILGSNFDSIINFFKYLNSLSNDESNPFKKEGLVKSIIFNELQENKGS
ncbi:phosphate ABC transporter substrate-binding protein [Spiroplasma litorale]|uniref:Phosphate ABC transporter substrate-binding protein n=1 Tax=Spiroplasma litorale TaxID=216942 RepID=A0A0K1W120_9MOLU|nr:phosphate ABC transporter substrate-binding protein [Spiroplasma litorale]AKX33863.1 phosphate ABC transporter substrate-binding protein [Spiroplasma litorale]